ncbi:HTTM domain-containing protein [Natronobiforma cellulositropha]
MHGTRATVRNALGASRRFLAGCVRIDTRALAAFRISLGALLLADVLLRARAFTRFYTAGGVVPPEVAREAAPVSITSPLHLSSSPTAVAALFVLHALVAVALLVGYETRVATFFSLIFALSVDLANPLVLSHADTLTLWLLFWALFLPLGERWSVDALHAEGEPRPTVSSLATAAILSQLLTMYLVNAYQKSHSEQWRSGEAAVLILGLDDTTYLFGDALREVPALLQLGGLTWYYMLACAWLLVLLRGRARILLVGLFVTVHASFALTVRIGAFAFVAIAGLLLFLQTPFWDACVAHTRRLERQRSDLQRRLEAAARALPARRRRPLLTSRTRHVTLAVVLVALSSALVVGAVGDERTPDPVADAADGATGALTAVATQQTEWNVFAPNPRTTDRYYVFAAETTDGRHLDVYNDRPLSFDRPHERLHHQYPTYRERFYTSNLGSARAPGAAPALAEYLCAEWTDAADAALTGITMYRIEEEVTRETVADPENRTRRAVELHRHGCDGRQPVDLESPPF